MKIIRKGEKRKMKKLGTKVGKFVAKNRMALTVMALGVLTVSCVCFGASADALWQTIANLIKTWVTRLGAVVMFVGGIMFGLGWKADDAEQKSRGISTLIAGAIVTAVAGLTGTFFA